MTGLVCNFSGLYSYLLITIFLLLSHKSATENLTESHKHFEYKYSFKPPYLAQKDGTVPFWEYGGNAIASSEGVRLAPSLRSQKGAIWTKLKTSFDWWEVEFVFRITGRGRIGADGLAFWYTTEKGDYTGPVFGSSDKWVGLGLIFDSFDNDNKHDNPYIMAVLNDGTKVFDHKADGSQQLLAGCKRDFRNNYLNLLSGARVEYYKNVLTVYYSNKIPNNLDNTKTSNEDYYEICFRVENVVLPKVGYFGVSAATGGLADDHDIFRFLTTSLHAPGEISQSRMVSQDDSEKLQREFQDYQQKLEKQKEDYLKDHPDKQKEDPDDWFESDGQRELRQILQGQNSMFRKFEEILPKVNEVVENQKRTIGILTDPSRISSVQQGTGQVVQVTGTITRAEVDIVLNNQNILLTTVREIRGIIGDIQSKSDLIISNQARAPTAHIQAGGYDFQKLAGEMKDGLNNVKQGMTYISQSISQAGQVNANCPTQTCLSLTSFLVVTAVQLLLLLCYQIYKSRSEAQAKKFY